jgi:hypothetical protein
MKKSTYEVITHELFGNSVRRTDPDGTIWSIPIDPANKDYAEYLASLEATEPEAE